MRARLLLKTKETLEMSAARKEFMDSIAEQNAKERRAIEVENIKISGDLKRIRQVRDNLQIQLDLFQSQNFSELKLVAEITDLSNARKDKIDLIQGDLKRLKMKLAASIPDIALMEFFEQDISSCNPYIEMKKELEYIFLNVEIVGFIYRTFEVFRRGTMLLL